MDFKSYVFDRFGIEIDERIIERKNDVILLSKSTSVYDNAEKYGIIAGRKETKYYKPTTDFIQLYGGLATRNVVFLSIDEFKSLLVEKSKKIDDFPLSRGYVILSTYDFPLGCGFFDGTSVKPMIPKSKLVGFIL